MKKGPVRAAVGLGALAFAAAGALAVATPASAHVTISPGDASVGERPRVDFRVPNESDSATTVALEVHFPEETPIASVSVGKVPGWSVTIAYRELSEPIEGSHGAPITEVVQTITWTAEDPAAEIAPGEFGEFPVALGTLPEADQLFFPALQTYSDGEIVRWIEEPAGGTEPDFPAPSLTLAASDAPATDGNGSAGSQDGEATEDGSEAASGDAGSGAGTWLGLAGLVAGLAGLALGGIAFTRTRSAGTTQS